jgi:hypothetical protein
MLPAFVYTACMKLLATFDADLSYSAENRKKDRLRSVTAGTRGLRGARSVMIPDVLIVSSVVFLTKLFWGYDSKPRCVCAKVELSPKAVQ